MFDINIKSAVEDRLNEMIDRIANLEGEIADELVAWQTEDMKSKVSEHAAQQRHRLDEDLAHVPQAAETTAHDEAGPRESEEEEIDLQEKDATDPSAHPGGTASGAITRDGGEGIVVAMRINQSRPAAARTTMIDVRRSHLDSSYAGGGW